MSKFTKHVGQDHLGNKLVIIFREMPDDPDHCLVVYSNNLSEMYHDQLMRVVESTEAQQTNDLYEVLQRRNFGDSSIMLTGLHLKGHLKKLSVDQVNVVPMPNRSAPLREVNSEINKLSGNKDVPSAPVEKDSLATKTREKLASTEQPAVGSEDQKKSLAESKLLQARLMEEDAQRLRKEAYDLDPSLKKGGRPSKKQQQKKEEVASD